MSYPPEFLDLVDKFIHLANECRPGQTARVSAAILFAAGRYNAFNLCPRVARTRTGEG